MSCDCFAAHLYGVQVEGDSVRPEILEDYEDEVELFNCLNEGEFPEGYPEEAEHVEFIGGPGNSWYVGYSAVMPYEEATSKEEMDRDIRLCLEFLFGETETPDTIFDTWCE